MPVSFARDGAIVVPTYSTTVRSSSDDIVLDLEVRVEDGCVELGLAVEAVADALPIGGWLGHGHYSSMHAHVTSVVLLWKEVLCGSSSRQHGDAASGRCDQGWSVPSDLSTASLFTYITPFSSFHEAPSEAQSTVQIICMTRSFQAYVDAFLRSTEQP